VPTVPQASRAAPPRPLQGGRPGPQAPKDITPSSDDLRNRKPQGTGAIPARNDSLPSTPGSTPQTRLQERERQQHEQQRQEQRRLEQREREQREREQDERRAQEASRPPLGPPSKSAPANSQPITAPAPGAAGALEGPPPVLPLQPKKVQIQAAEKPHKAAPAGGVAAAAAALEKPKEKRISTMTEVQVMEKLRQVVCDDDPKLIYSKIKKVGQG
jgi:serine/threonine-protein kinase CLA4